MATVTSEPPSTVPPPTETPLPTEAPTPEAPAPTETPAPTEVPPSTSGAEPATDTGSTVACNRQVIHIVKPGENLFRIALRYRTTIYAIARRNGITNVRLIRSGQRLRILTCARGSSPGTPRASGRTYVVKPGDNLFRIALRYGTTVQRIMAANGRYSTLIVPGQVLVIR
ncbi:MAG: LysM peptidoglycan-binding domain-containing protein [Chloroflexi bacterium]|nr:LysM peptidoglycan-binding domain-containing protein [Chloroflexota bacterium]